MEWITELHKRLKYPEYGFYPDEGSIVNRLTSHEQMLLAQGLVHATDALDFISHHSGPEYLGTRRIHEKVIQTLAALEHLGDVEAIDEWPTGQCKGCGQKPEQCICLPDKVGPV